MRTKIQIRNLIADRLLRQLERKALFSDLVSAIQMKPIAERNVLVQLLVEGKTTRAGELLRDMLKEHMKNSARGEADIILTDDSLSLEELDRII